MSKSDILDKRRKLKMSKKIKSRPLETVLPITNYSRSIQGFSKWDNWVGDRCNDYRNYFQAWLQTQGKGAG